MAHFFIEHFLYTYFLYLYYIPIYHLHIHVENVTSSLFKTFEAIFFKNVYLICHHSQLRENSPSLRRCDLNFREIRKKLEKSLEVQRNLNKKLKKWFSCQSDLKGRFKTNQFFHLIANIIFHIRYFNSAGGNFFACQRDSLPVILLEFMCYQLLCLKSVLKKANMAIKQRILDQINNDGSKD